MSINTSIKDLGQSTKELINLIDALYQDALKEQNDKVFFGIRYNLKFDTLKERLTLLIEELNAQLQLEEHFISLIEESRKQLEILPAKNNNILKLKDLKGEAVKRKAVLSNIEKIKKDRQLHFILQTNNEDFEKKKKAIQHQIYLNLTSNKVLADTLTLSGCVYVHDGNGFKIHSLTEKEIPALMADTDGNIYLYRGEKCEDWKRVKKDIVCKYAISDNSKPQINTLYIEDESKAEEIAELNQRDQEVNMVFAEYIYDSALKNVAKYKALKNVAQYSIGPGDYIDTIEELKKYSDLLHRLNTVDENLYDIDNDLQNRPIHSHLMKIHTLLSNIEGCRTLEELARSIKQLDLEILNLYYAIRVNEGFFSSRLGDTLESIIKSKKDLNLIEKYQIIIPHKFAKNEQQYVIEDLEPRVRISYPKNLEEYLINYIADREIQESRDNSPYHSFFSRLTIMSAPHKIATAKKILEAKKNNSKVEFDHDEISIANDGKLGEIINKFRKELPASYVKAEKDDALNLSKGWW